jgi:hypothetical protein
MEYKRLPVHRTIIVVDVQGFGDPRRANRHQVAVRDGLYLALEQAFREAAIPWNDCRSEDRGDGVLRYRNLNCFRSGEAVAGQAAVTRNWLIWPSGGTRPLTGS